MFRWAFIITACIGLTACISVTTPPSQSSFNPVSQDSASEIAELRREIRSLRDSMSKGGQSVPNPSQRDGNGID